jgi:hypothetical protein
MTKNITIITDNKDDNVFLLNPLIKNKLKMLIKIAPIKVTLMGSILRSINMSIINNVKKFKIKVKYDFNPRVPPMSVIRANNIISNISIIFIDL